jgi:hypothetical protein
LKIIFLNPVLLPALQAGTPEKEQIKDIPYQRLAPFIVLEPVINITTAPCTG